MPEFTTLISYPTVPIEAQGFPRGGKYFNHVPLLK